MGIPDPAPVSQKTDRPKTDRQKIDRPPRWAAELTGVGVALAITLVLVVHVAVSRSWLLYYDGDSLLNTLVWKSLAHESQHWAMSSVLFIPEIAVYSALSIIGLSVKATLTLNAIVNLMALYVAVRFVAGAGRSRCWQIVVSLAAFSAFGVLIMLETSASRDSFELASLMATTTYYSATVIAVLITIGLVRRLIDRGESRPRRSTVVILVLVVAVSTLTNPIFVAWAVVPLLLLVVGLALLRRIPPRLGLAVVLWMIVGVAAGFILRIPFASIISNTGADYVDLSGAAASLKYYGDLLAQRAQSIDGVLSLAVVGLLIIFSVFVTIIAARQKWLVGTFAAAAAWVIPVVVSVGAVVLGTHATRYLEPVFFAPMIALTIVPGLRVRERLRSPRRPRRTELVAGIAALAAIVVVAASTIPFLVHESSTLDSSVACVDRWVTASGRVGAGQYWTVRAPKAYLSDPRQLVQVDSNLGEYTWLVNRADYSERAVSFLVNDSQSGPFQLPAALRNAPPPSTIRCGRYTITDYHTAKLVLGPAHS